jgi:autotransporter-associated beta strand protein
MMSRAFASLMAAAVAFVAGTAQATTYNWNIATDGTWDTTSANWSGGSGTWVDGGGNDAVFSNTNLPLRISVNEARTMGNLTVGNGSNNGNFTFDGTGGGTLTVTNQATISGNTGSGGTTNPLCLLTNLTMTVGGNLGVRNSCLVIGGTSAVTVSGQINAPWDWGYVTIKDSATVIASNGVDALSKVWGVNLAGGTLVTKYISTVYWSMGAAFDPIFYFDGTTVKALENNGSFVRIAPFSGSIPNARVSSGGAIFDSNGYDIGVGVNMVSNSPSGGLTKLGAGSLTIFGTNTYAGVTAINGGTLVFSNATAFGNGGNITFGGGTLKYGTGFTTDLAARFKNSTGAVSIDDGGQDILLGYAVNGSNTGGLTKKGAGKMTLSGTNTYTGTTTVSGGTLALASGSASIGTASYATANSYTFNAASSNLLAGLSPIAVVNANAGAEGTGPVTLLTDRSSAAAYTIGNNGVITYVVGTANLGCLINQINLYSGWGDSGRENINLTSISYSTITDTNTFTAIPNSSINYEGGTANARAILTASGGVLASDVYAIKFTFGPQENNYVGYRELEVIGVRSASLPSATAVALANAGAVLDLNGNNQTIASLSGVAGSTTTVGRAALTMGALTLHTGATLAVQLGGTNATAYGRCEVTSGTINITNSLLSATLTGGYVPKVGDSFTIIRNSAGNDVAGSFANGSAVKVPGIIGIFTVSYTSGAGKDVVLRYRGAGTVVSFM